MNNVTYYQFAVSYRRNPSAFMVKAPRFETSSDAEIAARKYVLKNISWGQQFRVVRVTVETLIQS